MREENMPSKKTAAVSGSRSKEVRRNRIRQLVNEVHIPTQMALTERLQAEGFSVTQATVSRDIRELRLIKIADGSGQFHYENRSQSEPLHSSEKFYTMFRGSVLAVDAARNLLVIKTQTGMAQAVCATMDSLHWDQIIGTIAGDDTIFAVTRSDEEAEELRQSLLIMFEDNP